MAGEPVPLVAYANHGMPLSEIEPLTTAQFFGIVQYPMRASRLRWSGVPGLVLVSFRVHSHYLGNSCAMGTILEMSQPGVWRFPARELGAQTGIAAQVHNPTGRRLFLPELTVWGVLL